MPEYSTHLRECIGCLCNVNTTQTRQPRTGACAVCERPRPAHASPGLAGVCLAETETPEPGDFLLDETCIGNFWAPFSYEPLRNRPTNRPIHGASLPGSRLTCAVARPCGNSPSPLHRADWPRYGQAVGCQELHPYRPASRACLTLLKRSVASNSSSARRSSYKGSTNSAMPAAPGHTEHYG